VKSTAPQIIVGAETLSVTFDRFNIEAYQLFLRVKRLPEYTLRFNEQDETYTITAPARFAEMLGVDRPTAAVTDLPLADFLFDDQRAIVTQALESKRFAVWADCGLGKTPISLEWARQIIHKTAGRVIIFTLNEIVPQFAEECKKFYGDSLPILILKSREHMKQWAAGEIDQQFKLAITNYEKLNHKTDADQVVNELRMLAGVVADESSRLKTGGGKQKWALIKSCKGVEYKLSCTATPAPNEIMEFASQASFLEKMRSDNEIIWTYFRRDEKTHRWTVKKHARKAFFEFMAGWSIYVRDPKRYGWRLNMKSIPDPELIERVIPMTPEQREAAAAIHTDGEGNATLIQMNLTNTIERNKLGQIAKGFRYRKGEAGGFDRINSAKPAMIATCVKGELERGLQVLVWTVFDAESTLLAEALRANGVEGFEVLTGKTANKERLAILERFRHGETKVLISRAVMLGYGMNLQHCGSMIFSGFNDSYEQFYQALRRAYRYGQTKKLRVHIPYVKELEGDTWDNILRKQDQHENAIAEMEANYIKATQAMRGERIAA
jgi:hypothetical protein